MADTRDIVEPAHLFTVVIASVCDEARARMLQRACESVRAMAGGLDYSILVVANGPRISPAMLEWLGGRSDVRVVRLRSPSYRLARRVGAEMADAEFIAFLDDDDELMPNTLGRKIDYFREHPEVQILVTDGYRINGSATSRIFPSPEQRHPDLVETMLRAGWSASAMTLRMRDMDLSAFHCELPHLEWTLTTLELARNYRFAYLDEPMYRYYEDTPGSLYKTGDLRQNGPDLWRSLTRSYAGTRYDPTVRRRYGLECHNVAWQSAHEGRIRDAWRLHLASLQSPGGMAYAPFTTTLVFESLRRLFGRGVPATRSREG